MLEKAVCMKNDLIIKTGAKRLDVDESCLEGYAVTVCEGTHRETAIGAGCIRAFSKCHRESVAFRQQGGIWCPSRVGLTLWLHILNLAPHGASPFTDLSFQQQQPCSPHSALSSLLLSPQCA